MDRDEFLRRLRARLRKRPGEEVAAPALTARPPFAHRGDLLDAFRRSLRAQGGVPHDDPAELDEIVKAHERPLVVATREPGVPDPSEAVRRAGGELLWWPEAGRAGAERAAIGITGALLGVAETGSVLVSGASPGGRAPSLLPGVHVCFLSRDAVVPTLYDALLRVAHLDRLPSNLVFVSGPSKSADIGGELMLRVHGPGEVHVFLTGEPGGA